jgi:carbonic anhydrase/acetyltransferase-like protein (isoleucine patch superfamily)
VQEGAVLHADPGFPLNIGRNVTVGHQAMLHGCTVGDGTLVGIQAVVLNGAVIGKSCLVGAGAIVTERKSFPDRSLILGAPAKLARELTDEEVKRLDESAADYAVRGATYRTELERVG